LILFYRQNGGRLYRRRPQNPAKVSPRLSEKKDKKQKDRGEKMRVEPNINYRGFEDMKRVKTMPEQQPRPEESQYSLQEIEKAVGEVNKTTEAFNIGIRFKLHEGAGRLMLEVIDLETNEVIKEIPPKKLLDLAAGIREMIGLLLDEKK